MFTRLTDTDKKQQMCSTRISNIAVKGTLYVHKNEFNLVYENEQRFSSYTVSVSKFSPNNTEINAHFSRRLTYKNK